MLEEKRLREEMKNAINWIREYVKDVGAKGIVIGNSGGKDSATVLAMAVEAIGKENVLSVFMPCFSSKNDFEDATLVSKTFGVKLIETDLSSTYEEMENEINKKQVFL